MARAASPAPRSPPAAVAPIAPSHVHRGLDLKHSSRSAFTLVELLVVIVFIGILAGIAIARFGNTRNRAYTAAMKSDLRNLVTAEEAYFSDSSSYVAYGDTTRLNFKPSPGVSTPSIALGAGYWSATVTHSQIPGFSCGIGVKTVNPVVTDAGNGEPACR
jgi:prepilin-type N-terminal cleavage/methylation domain-containing protein